MSGGNKTGTEGKRYVRRISLDSLAADPKDGKQAKKAQKSPKNENERQTLRLTVRGLMHGSVRMEAEDGTAYTCRREQSRGTLWGDVVLAELVGRERVQAEEGRSFSASA